MAQILDGKILAQKIKDFLKKEVQDLKIKTGEVPRMVNIVIGDEHDACSYAKGQKKVAEYIGIDYELATLPAAISPGELSALLEKLNKDKLVNGVMLHKPVPAQIDYAAMANSINIDKDLEGVNVTNIGKMMLGDTPIIPCTPAAVMEHIRAVCDDIRGKEAVVVGHSNIVGKPLGLLLLRQYATVTACHIATSESGRLMEHVRRADILVVAVGKAALIKGEWIKKGAIVIDVGINYVDNKLVGDVEFDAACQNAAFITPVPGGVGPVTVVMLMRNGIEAFKHQKKIVSAL